MEKKIADLMNNRGHVPVDTKEVCVKVQPNTTIVKNLYDAMNLKLSTKGAELQFSYEDFETYIFTLFIWRVNLVNGGKRNPVIAKYVRVPALINLTLAQIGPAYDKDFGLLFKPEVDCDHKVGNDTLMERISSNLQSLADFGFSLAAGIPRNPEGDLGTMSFNLLEDMVRCYVPSSHPSKALLATVAMLATLTDTVTYRIEYGTRSEFEFLVRELIYRD